jgi:CheY-like chemotaxis protein
MFFKEWEVLIVDDEPDVIQVSRLAMRHFEVYGLPLRLHTANSKAEALKVFAMSPVQLPAECGVGAESGDHVYDYVPPGDSGLRFTASA